MKKYKCIILTLILIILTTASIPVFAINKDTNTNLLSKGEYKVSTNQGRLKPGRYKFALTKPNSVMYIYVIDKDCVQRFSKRFDSREIDLKGAAKFSLFSEGTLIEGDTVIIYGEDEIYFDFLKSNE